jgi:VWFA-related protein
MASVSIRLGAIGGAAQTSKRTIGLCLLALTWACSLSTLPAQAQSSEAQSGQSQTQPPANPQPAQDIPDAPSTVQPPTPNPFPSQPAKPGSSEPAQARPNQTQPDPERSAGPPMPPVETVPAGTIPRNQINPKDDLYRIVTRVNFVQVPVMVKDSDGRRVDGLRPQDFTVLEDGKKQTLTFFTSDPFPLSVAILLDIGMPDVALQKINQTYSSLVGAFSAYDEVALYTYSSTVSEASDFSQRPEKLAAILDEMKLVRGHNNGPPNLGGPLAAGPTVNGAPAGGPLIQPVNTPPREARVLNDAILQAALDLGKRGRDRHKLIFVISDGRELGSKASYHDVLKVLETRDIQVKAVVVDSGALPVFKELGKIHLKGQGTNDILPRYVNATGGGQPFGELTRNSIEDAYAQVTSEARNQYTLGYIPLPTTGSSAYRSIEVHVDHKGLNVYARDGYYAIPAAR